MADGGAVGAVEGEVSFFLMVRSAAKLCVSNHETSSFETRLSPLLRMRSNHFGPLPNLVAIASTALV
jgi:hypothetical protein